MHKLKKEMIESGAIDTVIESIEVSSWFDKVEITYTGKYNIGKVICHFLNCFEVSLKHDREYGKEKNIDNNIDYQYFIQDVNVVEEDGFYTFQISAWPLEGQIICKEIYLNYGV